MKPLEFDLKKEYGEELAPIVDQLYGTCDRLNMPFFLIVNGGNDGECVESNFRSGILQADSGAASQAVIRAAYASEQADSNSNGEYSHE